MPSLTSMERVHSVLPDLVELQTLGERNYTACSLLGKSMIDTWRWKGLEQSQQFIRQQVFFMLFDLLTDVFLVFGYCRWCSNMPPRLRCWIQPTSSYRSKMSLRSQRHQHHPWMHWRVQKSQTNPIGHISSTGPNKHQWISYRIQRKIDEDLLTSDFCKRHQYTRPKLVISLHSNLHYLTIKHN